MYFITYIHTHMHPYIELQKCNNIKIVNADVFIILFKYINKVFSHCAFASWDVAITSRMTQHPSMVCGMCGIRGHDCIHVRCVGRSVMRAPIYLYRYLLIAGQRIDDVVHYGNKDDGNYSSSAGSIAYSRSPVVAHLNLGSSLSLRARSIFMVVGLV